MTKTKAEPIQYTPEELELLAQFEAPVSETVTESTGVLPSFAKLVINTSSVSPSGKRVFPGTWNIEGTEDYAEEVEFRYFANYGKFIRQVSEAGGWKVTNETVFFRNGEKPYDLKGSLACKEGESSGRYYGFFYGMVRFPGKDWVAVSVRLPSGKAHAFTEAVAAVAKTQQRRPQEYAYKMTLTIKPGATHPNIEVRPDLTKTYTLTEFLALGKELRDHVDDYNRKIMALHTAAQSRTKDKATSAKFIKNSSELHDDEIPF